MTSQRRILALAITTLAVLSTVGYSNCSNPAQRVLPPGSDTQAASSIEARQPAPPAATPATPTCENDSFYIDSTAATNGNGSMDSPWLSLPSTLIAGECYFVKAGTSLTYLDPLTISTKGSDATWTAIAAYGSGARPTIIGGLQFDGAAYVQIKGFAIVAPIGAGLTIGGGSRFVQAIDLTIDGALVGAQFTNGDSSDCLLASSKISNARKSGILIYKSSALPGHENRISANTITGSGEYGVDAGGNWFVIDRNVISLSGQTAAGSAGLRAYAGGDIDSTTSNAEPRFEGGSRLTIRANVLFQNGAGVRLSKWTHDDSVAYNLAFKNDGAGISVMDSSNNAITYNSLVANRGAEVSITTDSASSAHLSTDNSVTLNQIISNDPAGFAVFVDAISTAMNQTFAYNAFENASGGKAFKWDGQTGVNEFAWRSVTLTGTGDTLTHIQLSRQPAPTFAPLYTFGDAAIALNLDGSNVTIDRWDPATGLVVQ